MPPGKVKHWNHFDIELGDGIHSASLAFAWGTAWAAGQVAKGVKLGCACRPGRRALGRCKAAAVQHPECVPFTSGTPVSAPDATRLSFGLPTVGQQRTGTSQWMDSRCPQSCCRPKEGVNWDDLGFSVDNVAPVRLLLHNSVPRSAVPACSRLISARLLTSRAHAWQRLPTSRVWRARGQSAVGVVAVPWRGRSHTECKLSEPCQLQRGKCISIEHGSHSSASAV